MPWWDTPMCWGGTPGYTHVLGGHSHALVGRLDLEGRVMPQPESPATKRVAVCGPQGGVLSFVTVIDALRDLAAHGLDHP